MSYDFSKAARLTNEELAAEISKLTPLTQGELEQLLPKKEDKARLAELLKILGSATSQNQKVAALEQNFAKLGGVAVTMLERFLKVV